MMILSGCPSNERSLIEMGLFPRLAVEEPRVLASVTERNQCRLNTDRPWVLRQVRTSAPNPAAAKAAVSCRPGTNSHRRAAGVATWASDRCRARTAPGVRVRRQRLYRR